VPQRERAAVETPAFGAHTLKIRRAPQVLFGTEAHWRRAENGRTKRLKDRGVRRPRTDGGRQAGLQPDAVFPPIASDDGQALAALAAAGLEDLAAATGGLAGAEADLAGAFFAVRTEGGLHREWRC
jgi:hypothetical protein